MSFHLKMGSAVRAENIWSYLPSQPPSGSAARAAARAARREGKPSDARSTIPATRLGPARDAPAAARPSAPTGCSSVARARCLDRGLMRSVQLATADERGRD